MTQQLDPHNLIVPFLYHGTSWDCWLKIREKSAILPRHQTGMSHWKHSVESDPSTIYLTNAYPLHFCLSATREGGRGAIIEIDTRKLLNGMLVADEDAVEQSLRGHDDLPKRWNTKRRTEYYRSMIDQYDWRASLLALGTCGYQAPITMDAITRVIAVDQTFMFGALLGGVDPVISLINYRICGAKYRHFTRWLFDRPHPGHEPKPRLIPGFTGLNHEIKETPEWNENWFSDRKEMMDAVERIIWS